VYYHKLYLCLKGHSPIKKLATNRTPVTLLNIKVDDMDGTRSSIESKFFRNPNPDFIIRGIVSRVIKDTRGNKFVETPSIIAQYDNTGKIQKSFAAFSFPTAITKDFLPLDLSAS